MTESPRRIALVGGQAAAFRRLQAFYQLGMPGMTLRAEKPKPPEPPEPEKRKPTIPRCQCGRPISANKTACRFCYETKLMLMAEQIENQAMLDRLMEGLEPGEKAEVLSKLKPYLKF